MEKIEVDEYRLRQLEVFDRLERKASEGTFGSFIPITEDFAQDNRVSLAAIKFLPKQLSELVWEKLSSPLCEVDERQFFFARESLHMTVQNVRKISDVPTFGPSEVEVAAKVFKRVAANFAPFEFSLEGLLVMPASIAIRAIAEPRFGEFSRAVRNELKMSGVPDDKPYIDDDIVFGNITFCRFTVEPYRQFRQKIDELKGLKLGRLLIDGFALMTTNSICDLRKTIRHESYTLGSAD